jgi:hypothetical protein
MTDDIIGDELHRLSEEFRKLANLPTRIDEETKPEQLAKFGLTLNEAKAWLKQEPNYPSDENLQGDHSDEDFTEPRRGRFIRKTSS